MTFSVRRWMSDFSGGAPSAGEWLIRRRRAQILTVCNASGLHRASTSCGGCKTAVPRSASRRCSSTSSVELLGEQQVGRCRQLRLAQRAQAFDAEEVADLRQRQILEAAEQPLDAMAHARALLDEKAARTQHLAALARFAAGNVHRRDEAAAQ